MSNSIRVALAGLLLAAGAAHAAVIVEIGDAGDTLGTAQLLTGLSGTLDEISGEISSTTDVDIFAIFLPGGTFGATTVGTAGTLNDTQLFLFDATGMGIAANDDHTGLRSTISLGSPTPGLYYLAITGFNVDPESITGLIFPNTFADQHDPTGPGGGNPLSGWTGTGNTGTYTIELRGAYDAQIPEPSSWLLIGSGLGALGLARRVRR